MSIDGLRVSLHFSEAMIETPPMLPANPLAACRWLRKWALGCCDGAQCLIEAIDAGLGPALSSATGVNHLLIAAEMRIEAQAVAETLRPVLMSPQMAIRLKRSGVSSADAASLVMLAHKSRVESVYPAVAALRGRILLARTVVDLLLRDETTLTGPRKAGNPAVGWPFDRGWCFVEGTFAFRGLVGRCKGKVWETLKLLAESNGVPVARDVIRETVWPGEDALEVDDVNIRQVITKVRQLLRRTFGLSPDDDPVLLADCRQRSAWRIDEELLSNRCGSAGTLAPILQSKGTELLDA